ncbi:putative leucine-rich repeat domain, L domain-containing protein [Medicago truncatula]|uniref:F-box/LRR plant protein n=2 Tax=Medicago truncatula TaxID=3880 RepID=A0A072UP06_MEDTR|nr:F-box/LRR plant protein [Medicago truncatula]RHN63149.1 putative leucine-rich repeat domain, L domain-containing protein [Medicago truncatula]
MEVELSRAVKKDVTMWEFLLKNFPDEILVEICKEFNIFESKEAVGRFIEAWKRASNDQPVWETLDFSMLKSDFVKASIQPYIWVHSRSDSTLYNLLFLALNISQGNIKTLIFNYSLYLTNDQFIYTAIRCPHVRRLVFVSWNRIKKIGIVRAIRVWTNLESMTMPCTEYPGYVFEEITKHCKNFRELKVIAFLPNLKVLSLRCSGLSKEALILILDELKDLEVLNISHSCHVVPLPYPHEGYMFSSGIDPIIIEKGSRLLDFYTCMEESCIMCQRTKADDGLPRWFRYEDGIWKDDEISSLAL